MLTCTNSYGRILASYGRSLIENVPGKFLELGILRYINILYLVFILIKMHHKIIFLIISSNDQDVYLQMKSLSPIYYSLYSNIKHFFIEVKNVMTESIIEENNFLYVKGDETVIPGMYQKTMKAIEYLSKNYTYDYIVRTNLSSFWNIPNLFKLCDTFPKTNFAGGYNIQGFISGTGIIMSPDVASILYTTPHIPIVHEDVAISQVFRLHNIPLYNITEYKWGFLGPQCDILPNNCRYLNIDDSNFDDILNFRIKNLDRNLDIIYFKILLIRLYQIY